jgi:protein BCP1
MSSADTVLVASQEDPALKPFLDYLLSTIPKHSPLHMLLDPGNSPALSNLPALVFSLRLLNLPLPLIPPLYKMLLGELDTSQPAREAVPEFTHWIVWGRGYRLEGAEQAMGLEMDGAG